MENLEYSFERTITPEQLVVLMRQTNFGRDRTVSGLRTMLKNTTVKLGVWDGERLVAFSRALCDRVYRAVIEDVIVDVSLRGRGIGTAMMKKMVEHLQDIHSVYLFTGRELATIYYPRFGFREGSFVSMLLHKES